MQVRHKVSPKFIAGLVVLGLALFVLSGNLTGTADQLRDTFGSTQHKTLRTLSHLISVVSRIEV